MGSPSRTSASAGERSCRSAGRPAARLGLLEGTRASRCPHPGVVPRHRGPLYTTGALSPAGREWCKVNGTRGHAGGPLGTMSLRVQRAANSMSIRNRGRQTASRYVQELNEVVTSALPETPATGCSSPGEQFADTRRWSETNLATAAPIIRPKSAPPPGPWRASRLPDRIFSSHEHPGPRETRRTSW